MTEAPSAFDSAPPSCERPRIVLRIRKSRLSAEFREKLWKEYDSERGRAAIEKNCSTEVKGQDDPKTGEQQVDYTKFDGSSANNLNEHDGSDDDGVRSIDTTETASKSMHFKKTLIRMHKNAILERESANDSDAPYTNKDWELSMHYEEGSVGRRTDDESVCDDMNSDQQDETASFCESTASSTVTNVSSVPNNTEPNIIDNKSKIMVLDNTIISSPSQCSSSPSLPDRSITTSLSPEQNKSPTIGKHVLPTVFIPQQQNSRVAVPLKNTTKRNSQTPTDKLTVEENLSPNYPNITVEIDTSNDNVKIRRIIEQNPPASIKGTLRRKSTIPVRRKSILVDENPKKEIIFTKEQDVLRELEGNSNTRQSGLDLLSTVCATTKPAPQLLLNDGFQPNSMGISFTNNSEPGKNEATIAQSSIPNPYGVNIQFPPMYNRSKSAPSSGEAQNTSEEVVAASVDVDFMGQVIEIPNKITANNAVTSGNLPINYTLTSPQNLLPTRSDNVENSRGVLPSKETATLRSNQMYQSTVLNGSKDPPSYQAYMQKRIPIPTKPPPEYNRSISQQPRTTTLSTHKDTDQRKTGVQAHPTLFRPYARSVSSPSQYANVKNDSVRITSQVNPHSVLQPRGIFNHPTYIPEWNQQVLLSNNLAGNGMMPTSNPTSERIPLADAHVPMRPTSSISNESTPKMPVGAATKSANLKRTSCRGRPRLNNRQENEQIHRNVMEANPETRYPPPYFNPVPMHYPFYHPMYYNPHYPLQQLPLVAPIGPIENEQINLMNQQLISEIPNHQLQQNLITADTTAEDSQINNPNHQNMLSMYNTQTTVVSPQPISTETQQDVSADVLHDKSPPTYFGTHIYTTDSGGRRIIRKPSEIEISIIPQVGEQNRAQKTIEMGGVSPKHVNKELLNSSESNTNGANNVELNTNGVNNVESISITDRHRDNKWQSDFLKKIKIFQANLNSEQIAKAFPKIAYSQDINQYPYIVQQLQDVRVTAQISQAANVPSAPYLVENSTVPGLLSQQPSIYALSPDLVENLLHNGNTPIEDHSDKLLQSTPKTKTPPSSKDEIDNNQVCTLYYESQSDKGQTECTKQTIIFTKTPLTEANLHLEAASCENPLLKDTENYLALIKLIDSLASTEHDRLLARTLLQYYPDEVLQMTMNRVEEISSDDVLHTISKAKQLSKPSGARASNKLQKIEDIPPKTIESSKRSPVELTVASPELVAKTAKEAVPNMSEQLPRSESLLTTRIALEAVTPEPILETPEVFIETNSKTPESISEGLQLLSKPKPSISQQPELKANSIKVGNNRVDNPSNIKTPTKIKGIPSSVIKQNPFATMLVNRKVTNFTHGIENLASSSLSPIRNNKNSTSRNVKDMGNNKTYTTDSHTRNQINTPVEDTKLNVTSENDQNEDISSISAQNEGISLHRRSSTVSTEDLTTTIDESNEIQNITSPLQKSTTILNYGLENSTGGVIVEHKINAVNLGNIAIIPEVNTAAQIKVGEKNSVEEVPPVNCVDTAKDSFLPVKEKTIREAEVLALDVQILNTTDRQKSDESVQKQATSEQTTDSSSNSNTPNDTSELENTCPTSVSNIVEQSFDASIHLHSKLEAPKNCSKEAISEDIKYPEKKIDEDCAKPTESNIVRDSVEDHLVCAKNASAELVKHDGIAFLKCSMEETNIQDCSQKYNMSNGSADIEALSENSSVNPREDDGIIFEIDETSPESSQTLPNQTPNEEVGAQTCSADAEVKEGGLKRGIPQNATNLNHNFLFDIKIGPNDDIESIYARIMPSCFMILNLIHEMQNVNNTNGWPVDTSGNIAKIKRSLRGISTFLKRSKKLSCHLDTRIHHFFIFLLQCFGTFRERVRRILDNGYALKENYISSSEADIYRDVLTQLYEYLSCTRVTDYANIVIRREEPGRKNKSANKSSQSSSYQPTKPFPNTHQNYMFIIKQLQQRRDAEGEKNENYKKLFSHLLDSGQEICEDDRNNNADDDDVIVIPDVEEVITNTLNDPTPIPAASVPCKRKMEDFIIIDSDSDEDIKFRVKKHSEENLQAQKKPKISKIFANIINLVDEEEDISNSNENINESNESSNKRQSSDEFSETNKRFCSNENLDIPPNTLNESEDKIYSITNENENSNEIHADAQSNQDIKDETEFDETELGKFKTQVTVCEKFNKPQTDLSNQDDVKVKADGDSQVQPPMVTQLNHEDQINCNGKDSPLSQIKNGDEVEDGISINKFENQATPEPQMEIENAQEVKHISNESDKIVSDTGNLNVNVAKRNEIVTNSTSDMVNLESSETIEAIKNYLRETDMNFQEDELRLAETENAEETAFIASDRNDSNSIQTTVCDERLTFKVPKTVNNENKVIGVAIPNVKDVTNSNVSKQSLMNGDNSVIEASNVIEVNNNNDILSTREDISEDSADQFLKTQIQNNLEKGDGTITQKLINFRKPPKKQISCPERHTSSTHDDLNLSNRDPLNIIATENSNDRLQNETIIQQNLNNIQTKCIRPVTINQSVCSDDEQKLSPPPGVPIESQSFQAVPSFKTIPKDPRTKPFERSPTELGTRKISSKSHENCHTLDQRNTLQTVANETEESDSLNTQVKAAISEYFHAQKIVARQIANPIQADVTIRGFENFRNTVPVKGTPAEVSRCKQNHRVKTTPPPSPPSPLSPPPNNSKELLRQAVTKRQLSNMQQSTPAQLRSVLTPIPTLQSIYNENIDTKGFISQYIKDEIGVLSKKESLGPREYVLEVNTLKRLPLIPKDFKEFYIFVTKQQILQLHQPIAFYIFLELLNQSGLKDYHKKFTEYTKRKYEDGVNLKKRDHSHYQRHRQQHHHQQQQQQLRHPT
ncbi:hypothetical protein Trydic_g13676 [Trypoxylus dichotomus]